MSFWEYFLNVNTITDRIHLYLALCKHPLAVEAQGYGYWQHDPSS